MQRKGTAPVMVLIRNVEKPLLRGEKQGDATWRAQVVPQ